MSKYFYDIHCHAMNMSHPNILAFIERINLQLAGLITIPIVSPVIAAFGEKKIKRTLNLLSVMENDIAYFFLVMEYYLKQYWPPGIDPCTINATKYDAIVLTPLLIDFGYKNITSDTFYRIPPRKPIVEQTVDVFNGIKKYCECELIQTPLGDYQVVKRQSESKPIFEIYPFLGINTKNYENVDRINESILYKYFQDYAGTHDALKANLGKFNGNLDDMRSNFFAGIKVYPPIGFDPWPEIGDERTKIERLYEYCCERNIPLTTHCNDGGFVLDKEDAGTFSAPARWHGVLEKYPNLKLNFAHLGRQHASCCQPPRLDWQHDIIALIQQYPNVYTDFSCRALDDDYYRSLSEIIASKPMVKDRILFGSDFLMNLLWIDSYNDYLGLFDATAHLRPEEKDLFCSVNPERFLFHPN
jgi:hypothetical protein